MVTSPELFISVLSSRSTRLVAYSDAEFTPGRPPRLGWVAFAAAAERVLPDFPPLLARTLLLDEEVLRCCYPRKQQIVAAEALAPSAALADVPALCEQTGVLYFIVIGGACSTPICGA